MDATVLAMADVGAIMLTALRSYTEFVRNVTDVIPHYSISHTILFFCLTSKNKIEHTQHLCHLVLVSTKFP